MVETRLSGGWSHDRLWTAWIKQQMRADGWRLEIKAECGSLVQSELMEVSIADG